MLHKFSKYLETYYGHRYDRIIKAPVILSSQLHPQANKKCQYRPCEEQCRGCTETWGCTCICRSHLISWTRWTPSNVLSSSSSRSRHSYSKLPSISWRRLTYRPVTHPEKIVPLLHVALEVRSRSWIQSVDNPGDQCMHPANLLSGPNAPSRHRWAQAIVDI